METTDNKRGASRRRQVVEAALRCFEENGFHKTSMAEISEAAGMSVGHIYHYFPGKEALIAAIVELHVDQAFEHMNEAARQKGTLYDVLLVRVCEHLDKAKRIKDRAAYFEVLAECERNPKIRDIIHKADVRMMERQRELFRELEPTAAQLSDAEIDARLETFNALLLGLIRRDLTDDGACDELLRQTVERVLLYLIKG